MAGRATYTESERAMVYAVLTANSGNIKRTARETGIPENTVRRWKVKFKDEGPPDAEIVADVADKFVKEAEEIRTLAMAQLRSKLPLAKVGELNAVIGTLSDKLFVMKGLATARTEHTFVLPSADELRETLTGAVQEAIQRAGSRQDEILDAEVVEVKQIPALT